MSTCKKFTDLISGKEYTYSEGKVNELKAKYKKDGLTRVSFYKKHCVLGQIKHYSKFLDDNNLRPKKSPKKKGSPKKKKSPPKKVAVKKCVREGCSKGTTCNAKSGRCVKNKPAGATKVEVAGEEFWVTTSSQKKKLKDFKGVKSITVVKTQKKSLPKTPTRKTSSKKKMPSLPKTPKRSTSMRSARTPSAFLERLREASDETLPLSDETLSLSEEYSDDFSEEEDDAVLSREDIANINAQKRMILSILEKCPQ